MSENLGLIGLGVAAAASFFYYNNNKKTKAEEEDQIKKSKKSSDKKKKKKITDENEETIVVTETRTLEAHKSDDAVSSGVDLGNIASRSITTAKTGEPTTIKDALKDTKITLPAELNPDYTVTSDATVTTESHALNTSAVTDDQVLDSADVVAAVDPTLEQVIEDVTATVPAAKVNVAEIEVTTSSQAPNSSDEVVVEATKSRTDILPQSEVTDLGLNGNTENLRDVTDIEKLQLDEDIATASKKAVQKSKTRNLDANTAQPQTADDSKTTLENVTQAVKDTATNASQSVKDTVTQVSGTIQRSQPMEVVKATVGDVTQKINESAPLQTVKENVQGALHGVTNSVNQAAPLETAKNVAQDVTNKFDEVAPIHTTQAAVQDTTQAVVDIINEAAPIETTKTVLQDVGNKTKSVVQSTQSTIQDGAQKALDAVIDAAPLEKAKAVVNDSTDEAAQIAWTTQGAVQNTVQRTFDAINDAAPLETTKSMANDALKAVNKTSQTAKDVVSDKIQAAVDTVYDAAPIENTKAIANDAVALASDTAKTTGNVVADNVRLGADATNNAMPLETAKNALDNVGVNVNDAAQTTRDVVVEKVQTIGHVVDDAAPIETAKALVDDAVTGVIQTAQTIKEVVQDKAQQGIVAVQNATPIQNTKDVVQETTSKVSHQIDDVALVQQAKKVIHDTKSKVADVAETEEEESVISAGNMPSGSSPSALSLEAPADWHLYAKRTVQASSSDASYPLHKYASEPESKTEQNADEKEVKEADEELTPAISAANPPTGDSPSALSITAPADWHLHPKHQNIQNVSGDLVHPLDKYASTPESKETENEVTSLDEKKEKVESDMEAVSAANPPSGDSPSALSKSAPTDKHLLSSESHSDKTSTDNNTLAKYAVEDSLESSYLESVKQAVAETKDTVFESLAQTAPVEMVKSVTNDIAETVSMSAPNETAKDTVNDIAESAKDTIGTPVDAVAESEPLRAAKEIARGVPDTTSEIGEERDKLTLQGGGDLDKIEGSQHRKAVKHDISTDDTQASSMIESVTEVANDAVESVRGNLDKAVQSLKESGPVQNVEETISDSATKVSESEPSAVIPNVVENISSKIAETAQSAVVSVKNSVKSTMNAPSTTTQSVENSPKYTSYEIREPFHFKSDTFHSTSISPLGLPSVPYISSSQQTKSSIGEMIPRGTTNVKSVDSSLEGTEQNEQSKETTRETAGTQHAIITEAAPFSDEQKETSTDTESTATTISIPPTTIFLSQPDGWLEHGLHPKNLPNSSSSKVVVSHSNSTPKNTSSDATLENPATEDINLDDTKLADVVKKSASALHHETTSLDRTHGITEEIVEEARTLVDDFYTSPLNPKNMA